ncbi:hypothetical protein ACTJJB_09770 [Chitinophaga sp. 22536]
MNKKVADGINNPNVQDSVVQAASGALQYLIGVNGSEAGLLNNGTEM